MSSRGFSPRRSPTGDFEGQYVGDDGESTNGVEAFWVDLNLSGKAIYRKRSPKHLTRFVGELSAGKNDRDEDTFEHMAILTRSIIGKRLGYRDLIALNGLPNQARRSKRQRKPERPSEAKPKRRAARTRTSLDTTDSAKVAGATDKDRRRAS